MDPNKQAPPPYFGNDGSYPGYPPTAAYPTQPYPQAGPPVAGFAYPGGPPPGPGFAPYPGQYNQGFQGGYPGGPPPAGFAPYPGPQQPPIVTGFRLPNQPDGPKPEDQVNYENGGGGEFEFSDKTIRRGFIRKVYSILMLQMVVTCSLIALFVYHDGVKKWFRANTWFYLVTLAMFVIMMIILSCCAGVRRKAPGNYICLGIFTVVAGAMLGAVSSTYNENTVLLAVGITTVVVFALTLFSFQTKIDFTRLNGFLFVCGIVLMIFGIVAIFLSHKFPILRIVYASLGALLFSVYLVHDTQLMMGGDHKYSISPEEYIFASLNIYLDVINIFLSILSLVGSGDR